MFTGIIEEIGRIKNIKRDGNLLKFEIISDKIINNISKGASVAINGVCLTVTEIKNNLFSVDVIYETVKTTNLDRLKVNSKVNLESALTLNKRLNGHIVLGHIDGVGKIKKINRLKDQTIMSIEVPTNIIKYMVRKGSVCIDGVSLTIVDIKNNIFSVALIPYTLSNTTLGSKSINELVNIEVDIISKYVEKFQRIDQ